MSRSLQTRGAGARGVSLAMFAVLTALSFALVKASADVDVKNHPASQGRPITPAGSLVMDLTTGFPAVGSLPVSFVRSPDASGPSGLGRYLVAVNSGYGLQFSSKTNKGQQSLSIIDLSLRPPAVWKSRTSARRYVCGSMSIVLKRRTYGKPNERLASV